jgi:hypothetical protein
MLGACKKEHAMNSNDFRTALSSTTPTVTLPFENPLHATQFSPPTSNFIYPCTVWATPASGSTVEVTTSFDGVTQTLWTPGTVTTPSFQAYASCPGTITFTLVSGTSATVGVT